MTKCILGAAFLVASALAAYAEEPGEIDVTAAKAQMKVLTDGKGHHVALVPYSLRKEYPGGDPAKMVFYSADGKTFYQLRATGESGKAESFHYEFWDPRVGFEHEKARLRYAEKTYVAYCEDRRTRLSDGDASLLDSAVFRGPRFSKKPYFLARDARGTYYYVDRGIEPEGNKAFRMWAGPKGRMKLTKLKNVVFDSKGVIFSTKTGDLRVIVDGEDFLYGFHAATWVKGKKKTALTHLLVEDNTDLIFKELGVYLGQSFGTPCDDL